MVDVASMNKLLSPGGMTLTSFVDQYGKSFGDGDRQFADREDGSGESGGENDRAAASTAAE